MMPVIEQDNANNRTVCMWQEMGINFRSNIIEPGGRIVLHVHSYDHMAIVTAGWFDCTVVNGDGEVRRYQVAGKDFSSNDPAFAPVGYRVPVPAGCQHTFELRAAKNVGEVLCVWPVGDD